METLIIVVSVGLLLALLVATHRNARLNNTGIAITLILWMLMLGMAIWTAALTAAKRALVERLGSEDLALALEAVDAVSLPALPSALLTALAFLSGGMVILPMLMGDDPKEKS